MEKPKDRIINYLDGLNFTRLQLQDVPGEKKTTTLGDTIKLCATTSTLDHQNSESIESEEISINGKNLTDDLLPKLLFQSDPTVVAAAAAAAAIKFRSNYLPPIGVFWDIENCQVSFLSFFL